MGKSGEKNIRAYQVAKVKRIIRSRVKKIERERERSRNRSKSG